MHGGEAAWQKLTDSSTATCGLGKGGDRAQTRKYDIRIVHKSHPACHANAKRWHTGAQFALQPSSHTLKLSPPLPAKPLPHEYLWNVESIGSILETLGCYATWRLVTETDVLSWSNTGRRNSFFCNKSINSSCIDFNVCTWFASRCISQDGKKEILLQKVLNKSSTTQSPLLRCVITSTCHPLCLVCKSAFPIGTAWFHVMTHGFNMGWNN